MPEIVTKPALLRLLKERRAEIDAAVDEIDEASMMQEGAAGYWSVKDIIAHLTYYEGWMADRMEEALRGETYYPSELDMMHYEPRNTRIYEQTKDLPLADVLANSKAVFARLVAITEAHDEAFLTTQQQFEGLPAPIIVADMLRSEVYDHYPQHVPSLKSWAAAHPKKRDS